MLRFQYFGPVILALAATACQKSVQEERSEAINAQREASQAAREAATERSKDVAEANREASQQTAEAQREAFLLQQEGAVIPIEVKSAPSGRLKSLHSYALQKKAPMGIRIHSGKAGLEELDLKMKERTARLKLLNLPFYLVGQVGRLSREVLEDSAP